MLFTSLDLNLIVIKHYCEPYFHLCFYQLSIQNDLPQKLSTIRKAEELTAQKIFVLK
jgi:hypothetical protein